MADLHRLAEELVQIYKEGKRAGAIQRQQANQAHIQQIVKQHIQIHNKRMTRYGCRNRTGR